MVFFCQAEDGIRDADVTGVQTCALPISSCRGPSTTSTSCRAIPTGSCTSAGCGSRTGPAATARSDRAASPAAEIGTALLRERPRPLLGVLTGEDRHAEPGLHLERVVFGHAFGLADRRQDGLDRQRTVGRDQIGQ